MARKLLPLSLAVTLSVFFILSGLFGEDGYIINRDIRLHLPSEKQELAQLRAENAALTVERDRLASDYQRILEEAYRYGYLQENEFRIIYDVHTATGEPALSSEMAARVWDEPQPLLSPLLIRLFSVAAGLLTLLAGWLYGSRLHRRRSDGSTT